MKPEHLLVSHSENPRALKNRQGLSSFCVEEKPQSLGYTGHFPGLVFPHLIPELRNTAWGKTSHSAFFCCSTILSATLRSWMTFIPMCICHQILCQLSSLWTWGVLVAFKKYYSHCTFCQAVKASGKSGTTLQQFWKGSTMYKPIKNIDFAWCDV